MDNSGESQPPFPVTFRRVPNGVERFNAFVGQVKTHPERRVVIAEINFTLYVNCINNQHFLQVVCFIRSPLLEDHSPPS